ncbi:alpha/beta hydrolase [Marinoscillum sp. MHG1-6]|uniref:alpha/beta hydrolase n=1 Tax=Marinoscillum sp. MHG1-6 TaxID=2959627 RepID=UPI0021584F01|nr:alpha/beta hydrolase [Marinoscillum sp. MHG1-6]
MNKYLLALLTFMFSSILLLAQGNIIPLWDDEVPNSIPSAMEERTVIEGSRKISQVVEPTIEVFIPESENTSKQAVLICPGGGYGRLAYDKEGTMVAQLLNEQGIVGVVLKYRLPEDESNKEPHLSPLMDVKRGMELIRENAEQWGVDPQRVGVMGFSAGGHLASTLGTHFDESNRPDFMVLVYPVVTMKLDYTHMGSRLNLLGKSPTNENVEWYSNELQVKSNTPPTFITHSQDDRSVPVENTLQLYSALKAQNVPVEMHLYPYGGHGFGLASGKGRLSQWSEELIRWLKEL